MRFYYVSLLAAGAYFESAKGNSVPTDSTPSTAAWVDSLTAGKDGTPVLRSLRTTVTADEGDTDEEQSTTAQKPNEERAFSFDALLSNIDAFKSKSKTSLLGMFKSKAVEHAFQKYGLTYIEEDELFKHENLIKWFEETKNKYPKNYNKKLVSTMSKYYGADTLYKLLGEKNTENFAVDLQEALLKYWLAHKTSPGEAFTNMGLKNIDANNLLSNPDFLSWVKYVEDFNKANPKHMVSEIDVVLNIKNDIQFDADLRIALEEAIHDVNPSDVVVKLEAQLKEYNRSLWSQTVNHLKSFNADRPGLD